MQPINANWANPDGSHDGGVSTGIGFTISWQRGPLENGRNGAFMLEVLDACRHQLEYYQNSKFACGENQEALQSIDRAIKVLQERRERRQQEGKLGTHQV